MRRLPTKPPKPFKTVIKEAFKAHQELSDLVKVVKGEKYCSDWTSQILRSMLSVSISNKSWTMPMPTTSDY